MKCPICGNRTYTSVGGREICPECGYGSPTVATMKKRQLQELEEYRRSISESPADRSYRSGEWELKIVYKARGTKSEGPHGVLYKDGGIIEPHHVGEVINTDFGILKYYSHLEETEWPWISLAGILPIRI
jgi:ribosomal protein L37E